MKLIGSDPDLRWTKVKKSNNDCNAPPIQNGVVQYPFFHGRLNVGYNYLVRRKILMSTFQMVKPTTGMTKELHHEYSPKETVDAGRLWLRDVSH